MRIWYHLNELSQALRLSSSCSFFLRMYSISQSEFQNCISSESESNTISQSAWKGLSSTLSLFTLAVSATFTPESFFSLSLFWSASRLLSYFRVNSNNYLSSGELVSKTDFLREETSPLKLCIFISNSSLFSLFYSWILFFCYRNASSYFNRTFVTIQSQYWLSSLRYTCYSYSTLDWRSFPGLSDTPRLELGLAVEGLDIATEENRPKLCAVDPIWIQFFIFTDTGSPLNFLIFPPSHSLLSSSLQTSFFSISICANLEQNPITANFSLQGTRLLQRCRLFRLGRWQRGSRLLTLLLFRQRLSSFSRKLRGLRSKMRLLFRLSQMRVSNSARGWREMMLFLERESNSMLESQRRLKSPLDSKDGRFMSLRIKDLICEKLLTSCFQNIECWIINSLESLEGVGVGGGGVGLGSFLRGYFDVFLRVSLG